MCRKEDPLHGSGHVARTHWDPSGQRRMVFYYWKCDACGKESKTRVLVRI